MAHLSRQELMAYAENLVDGGTPICARTAKHVTACPPCTGEVEAMRASLKYVASSRDIEPSSEFTAQLLLAAQKERAALARHPARRAAVAAVKGLACAAGIVLVTALCFSMALNSATVAAESQAAAPAVRNLDTGPSPEAIRKATAEIQTLMAAVSTPSRRPQSPWEIAQRRTVSALGADIEAARAALERNPGCVRASRMVGANLERLPETLKALYVERSL